MSKDKVIRQIKLAELQKQKQAELAKAKEYQMTETNKQDAVKNDKIQQLITKVSLMQKLKMK